MQVVEAEARYAGLQGAIVVLLRSMVSQEKALRGELGHLASELDASMSTQCAASCGALCACTPTSRSGQQVSQQSQAGNGYSGAERPSGGPAERRECRQGSGQGAGQAGRAAGSVRQKLRQLSIASAPSERAAREMRDLLYPVPSTGDISTALGDSSSSQAEAHMDESQGALVAWLQAARASDAGYARPD